MNELDSIHSAFLKDEHLFNASRPLHVVRVVSQSGPAHGTAPMPFAPGLHYLCSPSAPGAPPPAPRRWAPCWHPGCSVKVLENHVACYNGHYRGWLCSTCHRLNTTDQCRGHRTGCRNTSAEAAPENSPEYQAAAAAAVAYARKLVADSRARGRFPRPDPPTPADRAPDPPMPTSRSVLTIRLAPSAASEAYDYLLASDSDEEVGPPEPPAQATQLKADDLFGGDPDEESELPSPGAEVDDLVGGDSDEEDELPSPASDTDSMPDLIDGTDTESESDEGPTLSAMFDRLDQRRSDQRRSSPPPARLIRLYGPRLPAPIPPFPVVFPNYLPALRAVRSLRPQLAPEVNPDALWSYATEAPPTPARPPRPPAPAVDVPTPVRRRPTRSPPYLDAPLRASRPRISSPPPRLAGRAPRSAHSVVIRIPITIVPGSVPFLLSSQAFLAASAALDPTITMRPDKAFLSFADWGDTELLPLPDGSGSPSVRLFPTAQRGAYAIKLDNGAPFESMGPPVPALFDSGCAASVSAVIGEQLVIGFAHSVDLSPGAPVQGLNGTPMPSLGHAFVDLILTRPRPASRSGASESAPAPTYHGRPWPMATPAPRA